MARPQSEGLDYFPLDVDMDSDDKIEFIEAKYGLVAFGIIVRLLMSIYRNGYYMMWTERQQYVFSKRVNVDINTISEVINVCINEGMFDKNIYNKYGAITSHGIQCRYLKACERRKNIQMIKEFCLFTNEDGVKTSNISYKKVNVDINSDSTGVNVDMNSDSSGVSVGDMSAETPQSKVKESKVNISTTTESGEDGLDHDFGMVIQEYSDNIHPVSPIEAELLGDFLKEFSPEVIIKAIQRAVKRNGRSIGYVEGILKSWKKNGIDEGDGNDGKRNSGGGKPPKEKGSSDVDWSKFDG